MHIPGNKEGNTLSSCSIVILAQMSSCFLLLSLACPVMDNPDCKQHTFVDLHDNDFVPSSTPPPLLSQVIKNPVTNHLPTGCKKVGTSFHADKTVDLRRYASDKPVVFVIGAMAHGKVV